MASYNCTGFEKWYKGGSSWRTSFTDPNYTDIVASGDAIYGVTQINFPAIGTGTIIVTSAILHLFCRDIISKTKMLSIHSK